MPEVNIYIHKPCPNSLKIVETIRKNGSRKVRLWVSTKELGEANTDIQKLVKHWRDRRDIDQKTDNSIGYYEWNLETCQVEPITSYGFRALIQRWRNEKLQFVVLNVSEKCKKQMSCFVDAKQLKNLPDMWINCRWFTNEKDIYEYLIQNNVFDFDLNNTTLFKRTREIKQGQPVYKEISTGNLI